MALIDYIIQNKDKYFDSIVTDDIIKKLKENDTEIEKEIEDSELSMINMIDKIMGGTFGGEISTVKTVHKNFYYLDKDSNLFYYYDTTNDTVEGSWANAASDTNWKEYSLHNRVSTEIQGVSNDNNVDVTIILNDMENRLKILEEKIVSVSTRVESLEGERYPVGTVIFGYFPEDSYNGYIDPDGAMLKTEEYPELFKIIGYSLGGAGNYFKIFDMRGRVVRALDMGAGIDPGRILGSIQGDMLLAHKHTGETDMAGSHNHAIGLGGNGENEGGGIPSDSDSGAVATYVLSQSGEHSHTFTTDLTGGTENRMKKRSSARLVKV